MSSPAGSRDSGRAGGRGRIPDRDIAAIRERVRIEDVVGDYVQLNVWYSTESSITATDSTAGVETRIELVWDGA